MSLTQSIPVLELPKVHPRSQAGFGVGKAELYDAGRASYAPEVLSYIRKAVSKKGKLNIVEIASGSGKFTRVLLTHPEWSQSIAQLKCIEPNEGMRDVFAKTVNDPRVSLSDGTFDSTGVPDNWADFIVVATAFHWCMHLEDATKEFIRILKPDGVVCFLWNLDDRTKVAWVQQIHDIYLPKYKSFSDEDFIRWRQMFDLPVYKENFTVPEDTSIAYTEPGSLESVTARIMTGSGTALRPDKEREYLKEGIKVVIKRGDGLVWIDEKQGIFEDLLGSKEVPFNHMPGDKTVEGYVQ